MTTHGKIIDSQTGAGIPFASISLIDLNGQFLGQGIATGSDGSFGLTSSLIDNNLFLISSTGYGAVIADPALFAPGKTGLLKLEPVPEVLPGVTVTAKKNNSSVWWWIAGLTAVGVGVGIATSNHRKKKIKKRIGEAAKAEVQYRADYSKYVIPVAVVVGGYFVLSPLLQKLGLTPDQKDAAAKAAADAAAAQQKKAAQTVTGNRNYSDNDLQSLATQLNNTVIGTLANFGYDYANMAALMAYFSGFYYADAVKFLGFFATNNGVTLYQWWVNYFEKAFVIHSGPFQDAAQPYAANYKTMGIGNLDDYTTTDLLKIVVSYVYNVAKTSFQ